MRRSFIVLCSLLLLVCALRAAPVHALGPQGPWVRYPGNPVLSPGPAGSWDSQRASCTILYDGSLYRMWYTGYGGTASAIGYATSPDGLAWTTHPGNPVLSRGEAGTYDAGSVAHPSVIFHDGLYRMWYRASSSGGASTIAYAESTDGIVWTRHGGNPVLSAGPAGTFDSRSVNNPAVVYAAGSYQMWYAATPGTGTGITIGHATSPDGVSWTRSATNPVLGPGEEGAWDWPFVMEPAVVFDPADSTFHKWYAGYNSDLDEGRNSFGYATSSDGVTWSKHTANPVLRPGAPESWDGGDMHRPAVLKEGDTYRMWYWGINPSYSSGAIGLATTQPAGSICGQVRTAEEAYVGGVTVRALYSGLAEGGRAITTAADGSYCIADLAAGACYVEASGLGYGREFYPDAGDLSHAVMVTVTAPAATTGIDFALDPGASIEGRVLSAADGAPLAGIPVAVTPADGYLPLQVLSGADGGYAVHGLASGDYTLKIAWAAYLAVESAPVHVTQPDATSGVDLALSGPYFPLHEGDAWHYVWSNDVHYTLPIREKIVTWGGSETQYRVHADHPQAYGDFWVNSLSSGLSWAGGGSTGGPAFPIPMYMLFHYVSLPGNLWLQPALVGRSWQGTTTSSGYPTEATSTLAAVGEIVTVPAGTFTETARIHTVISSTHSYIAGERDLWFAANVGLVRMAYHHGDGSTTLAQLAPAPPTITVTMDGLPWEWANRAPVNTDPCGDATAGTLTDLSDVYAYQDSQYVYFMVAGYRRPLVTPGTLEMNLALISAQWQPRWLHTNINSDGTFSAWADQNGDGQLEEYPLPGAMVAWGDVMEVRLPRGELDWPAQVRVRFTSLWTEVDGQWTAVDQVLPSAPAPWNRVYLPLMMRRH